MATSKNKQRSGTELRNEGQSAPIDIRRVEGKLNYQASLENVGAPSEVFAADAVDIVLKGDSYRLAFSMSKLYGHGARAMVEVMMSTASAKAFRSSLDSLGAPLAEPFQMRPLEAEPANSVSIVANFARISTNEIGTTLDFYFVSPISIERAEVSGIIQYKDIVRISTLQGVFYAVVKYFLNAKELDNEQAV